MRPRTAPRRSAGGNSRSMRQYSVLGTQYSVVLSSERDERGGSCSGSIVPASGGIGVEPCKWLTGWGFRTRRAGRRLALASCRTQQEAAGSEGSEAQSGALHGGADLGVTLADSGGFWVGIVGFSRWVERHLEDFGEVQGAGGGCFGDLLAAAESVGDEEPIRGSFADGGEEFELSDGLGH